MGKRVFWIALGATAGVLVVRKASKALHKFTPSGIADGAAGLPGAIGGAFQDFADDVRAAAAEREFELYRVLGVDVADPSEDDKKLPR
ncbi:MAG TPA: hypothetical protein VFA06_17225 [Actinocrinis sp.]|jgi:hypothetical protein|uniref:hypothetical protein n=1 Tax=Actinocrinis sp. TaxID=1920516 RepID=UPI002D687112|nr:hypothetical protein [Actinocrinis sp.]HZU57616.1 hypothetical protein [Actinocrinis sp.]